MKLYELKALMPILSDECEVLVKLPDAPKPVIGFSAEPPAQDSTMEKDLNFLKGE